jgi:hypothetical protein
MRKIVLVVMLLPLVVAAVLAADSHRVKRTLYVADTVSTHDEVVITNGWLLWIRNDPMHKSWDWKYRPDVLNPNRPLPPKWNGRTFTFDNDWLHVASAEPGGGYRPTEVWGVSYLWLVVLFVLIGAVVFVVHVRRRRERTAAPGGFPVRQ